MKNNNFKVELIINGESQGKKELNNEDLTKMVYMWQNLDKLYYNIDILNYKDYKNLENMEEQQKDNIIEKLEFILQNVKDYNNFYSSDYYSLLQLLSDIKYYNKNN